MISKKLQSVFYMNFNEPVVGSLVVGEYLYVLGSTLYKCKLDGDEIEESVTLATIENPSSIATDGTFLYIVVTREGLTTGTRIAVVRISDFTLRLISADISTSTRYIGRMSCDSLGFLHTVFRPDDSTNSRWRIYNYDSDLNTIVMTKEINPGNSLRELHAKSNLIYMAGTTTVRTSVYSWDGVNETLVSTFPLTTGRLVLHDSKIISMNVAASPSIRYLHAFSLNEDNELIQEHTNDVGMNGQRVFGIVSGGQYLYIHGDTLSNLYVVTYENTEFNILDVIALPETFIADYDYPNTLFFANNRLYIVNGDYIRVFRWKAHAEFTYEKTGSRTYKFTAL